MIEQKVNSFSKEEFEDIPNASPLVLPGYNLPENIFNKGKPFYLEKDPVTGQIDFDSKSDSLKLDDDLYDYLEDEPASNIYDKANINRKDGSFGSHKPSNINQLTPNFHDFLNLPIKYNSEKYVYPLISSSYANTKIQGNVNKHHNHKDYNMKTTTIKPTVSPAYYTSPKNYHFSSTKSTIVTTTPITTTAKTTTETLTIPNLMNSNHPNFHEDFEEYYDETEKPIAEYVTSKNVNNIYLTTPLSGTTTKRTLSVFEHLFGEYEDEEITSARPQPPPPPLPSLFINVPINKNTKNKYETDVKTEKPSYATTTQLTIENVHSESNVLTGSNMGLNSYEFEDDYIDKEQTNNLAVKNTLVKDQANVISDTFSKSPLTTSPSTSSSQPSIATTLSNRITHLPPAMSSKKDDYYDYDYHEKGNDTTVNSTFVPTEPSTSLKVTSLPLGEHHITGLNNHQPIIVATQNLRNQLNNEKVIVKPFGSHQPPSTSNVHIAPDQDIVSFVVSDHQNVDDGQHVGSSSKGSPYDSNPFRPLYGSEPQFSKHTVSYTVQNPDIYNLSPGIAASSVTIQPLKNSEASLAIGVPVNTVKQVPGQVVDEKLDIDNNQFKYSKVTGTKIVFPDEKKSNIDSLPPPMLQPPNREVLQLSSKPMYHQLPSNLTPPKEQESMSSHPTRSENRPRPPWDPRPGHFYSGKPEYARPPRPSPAEIAYKRIDTLPNILPQFRPNMKPKVPPLYLNRQPLLERPSNRPIGFFEKLQPPPPPKNLHSLRKIPPHGLEQARPFSEPPKMISQDQFNFYQSPPKVVLANRRIGNIEGDVETLQMIQAKQAEKEELKSEFISGGTDKPLYVVYPANTHTIKLDVIETNKKESVVIGTRAELPLPPSKINQNFDYEQNPILNPKDRNDAPILKPHIRPQNYPIKSDFPYPLERPDSILAVPDTPSNNKLDEPEPMSTNEWNTIGENIEGRIINGINKQNNQISVTLKTYTEKPIAVAYTPTESHERYDPDKYSLPNYAGSVIPEIRPGIQVKPEFGLGKPDSEFTVSAIMHTHPQRETILKDIQKFAEDKTDIEIPSVPQLDFQAPFQASVNIDSMSQGWSVVSDKPKLTTEGHEEITVLPLATTSEFDIENFKPELLSGFKPIYNLPETPKQVQETKESDRKK